jgi:putative ATPase
MPQKLDDFVGQDHILGKDKLFYRMIIADSISSVILFGPPGTGKSSIAKIIAVRTEAKYYKVNAVTSGIKELKQIIDDTKNRFLNPQGRSILFIDEIHRFNKLQQDVLLPSVEDGSIILIGATTENPYFEVNKALISRSTVFMFKPLTIENIRQILQKAVEDKDNGLGNYNIRIADEIIDIISGYSNGDARVALNTLELAVISTNPDEKGIINITREVIDNCIQRKTSIFDKNGEEHYDTISAFIKSMRGSDPQAAVYYLARMIEAGEDPLFIARRIIICASEDVGLANSNALRTAVSCAEAVTMIGMPEARIILSHAALEVAMSPKSNSSYMAIDTALGFIRENRQYQIPMHLRNAPVDDMKKQGYSIGYDYPHLYENHFVRQSYLPDEIKDKVFYCPSDTGNEKRIDEYNKKLWSQKGKNEK